MADEFPHVDGVEHRFVEANGIRIHLAEAGPPDGVPLLLLHGWPQHWYMWRRVIVALREDFRLLAPDLRGFGWSEAPGDGYDGGTFAADQVALLDALGIDRASVIGHDWGGWTTMLLGLRYPERFDRLINCNAPHPWTRLSAGLALETWRSWYGLVNAAPGLGRRANASGWMPRWILTHGNFGSPFSEDEIETYVARFREAGRSEATVGVYRYYQRVFREGARGRWRGERLRVPGLILFGERDLYITPKLVAADAAARHADDLRVELVPDCGHFIVDEKPDLVIERAREFLGA